MTKVIALTQAQADQVRGNGLPDADLEPIPYAAGGYILPLAVLDDLAHADVHDFLASLPQIDYVAPPPSDE